MDRSTSGRHHGVACVADRAVSLATLWLSEATAISELPAPARAVTRGQWVESTLPVWQELAEPVATSIADALRVYSSEMRDKRVMRAEEKAARLPAIMTVPLILFILPTLFVVILGPAACSISDAFGK